MITLERFRKKNKSAISVVDNRFTSVQFPSHGDPNLSSCITGNYSLNDDNYLAECVRREDEQLEPLIQTATDDFNVGETFKSLIAVQTRRVKSRYQEEVALNAVQGARIINERKVREDEIDRNLPLKESKINRLNEEIAPLEGKHARFTLPLGRKLRVSMGVLATLLAMVFDAYVNYSFFERSMTQAQWMLIITVIGLSLISDLTTCVAGILWSQHEAEPSQGKKGFYFSMGVLLGLYVFSVGLSIALRFGSMGTTFGTLSGGEIVPKEGGFTLFEYALTLGTALITPTTGYICLLLSRDPDGVLENRRLRLEAERDALQHERDELLAERQALELAPDPMIRDRENRQAAEQNFETLCLTLQQHAAALLALYQKDPAYTDAMSQYCEELLTESETQPTDNATADNEKQEPNLKEVV
ncbi:MAG: hypothetical protein LUH42_02915 [Oscillospiraceae bacterium]|nr:hypothetical protein [Oscillospiraceae bacterium]